MYGMKVQKFSVFAWALSLALIAGAALAQDWDPKPKADPDEGGDKKRLPIVFVHGANGAGDQFERQAMHFTSNGYPVSWINTFDYNTSRPGGDRELGGPPPRTEGGAAPADGAPRRPPGMAARPETIEALDKFIDAVRKRTGFDKVNLVGHSLGTFQSAAYLKDATRAAKIAHYASVGGGPADNPNGVPSIAVSGLGDITPNGPAASNGGKQAWMPDYQDHVMVCTSDESFWAIYTFFNDGEKPKNLRIQAEEKPQVGGFAKSYIVNKPLAGSTVDIYEVAKETGMRVKEKPLISFTVAENGEWGPFSAKPGQNYEFVVNDKNLSGPRITYRTPFSHTDRLVYLRMSGPGADYAQSPFDKAPKFLTDKNTVFVVRHQNGSLLPGVMTLKINGKDLIIPEILPTTKTARQNPTVGLYLADGNENGKSDFTRIEDAAFRGAFVTSADVFIPADPKGHVEFRLNDHVLNVPALAGSKAGAISVVFEDFN